MIQRIQSLYLLLTTFLTLLFLKGGIVNFVESTGSVLMISFNGVFRASVLLKNVLPVTFLVFAIPVLALCTLLYFKNRRIQLIMVGILIALILIFIGILAFYSFTVSAKFNVALAAGYKMAIPFIQLIFTFLAYKGIKKDDALVKSYDRLR